MTRILGTRFNGPRRAPWEYLGTDEVRGLSLHEAFTQSGLDYPLYTAPLHIEVDGAAIPVPGKKAVVRDPIPQDPELRIFGVVGDGYTPVSNTQLADIVSPLTRGWNLDRVGFLGYGERVFATWDVGTIEINGDPIQEYFLLTNGHDGGMSLSISYTPKRIYCANSLTMGIRSATLSTTLTHDPNVLHELRLRVDLLSDLKVVQKRIRESFEHMAAMKLAEDQIAQVIAAAFPDPTPSSRVQLLRDLGEAVNGMDKDRIEVLERSAQSHEISRNRVQRLRDSVRELYEIMNQQFPLNAHSAWHVFNAVTELSDHRDGNKRGGSTNNIAISAMFGPRAQEKSRAYKAVMDIAKTSGYSSLTHTPKSLFLGSPLKTQGSEILESEPQLQVV